MSLASGTLLLAAEKGDNFDPDKITPGTIGFVVVALLGVALFFLLRSMTRHLGRVRFEEKDEPRTRRGRRDDPPAPEERPETR